MFRSVSDMINRALLDFKNPRGVGEKPQTKSYNESILLSTLVLSMSFASMERNLF